MSTSINAIHFTKAGSAAHVLAVKSVEKPQPEPTDLLVKIKACSVNPVDTKIRQGAFPAPDITGFDAAGVVESVGSSVHAFKEGDEVYYSGSLGRPGTTAQYNLVDYRIAAIKPRKLDWVAAACVPLVTLTAWELLEDSWGLQQDDPSGKQKDKSIVIINGAGGVGSIATQLARNVFKLGKVIVTASRAETIEHARQMGATDVISHREPLKEQLKSKIGVEGVDYVFICYDTNSYMQAAVDIGNQGAKIGSIVEVSEQLKAIHSMDAMMKAMSFHWEFMFSKAMFKGNLESQGDILSRAAKLFDTGVLTSLEKEREVLTVQSLVKAHEKLESGKAIGKIGLEVGDDLQ